MRELEVTLTIRNNRLKERRLALGMSNAQLADAAGIDASHYGDLERLKRHPRKLASNYLCLSPGCIGNGGPKGGQCCRDHKGASAEDKAAWRAERRANPPPRVYGEWRDIAIKLAEFHRCLPEDLFPEAIQGIVTTQVVRTVDVAEVPGLVEKRDGISLPPDKRFDLVEVGEQVQQALATLSPREAYVLRQRFGIDGADERTLEDIGNTMEITRERVRDLEARALRKLRHPSHAHLLKEFVIP